MIAKKCTVAFLWLLNAGFSVAQNNASLPREQLLMDFGRRFAYGHPYDTKKCFDNGTSCLLSWGTQRKLFNGLAQVVVQSTGEEGEITLTATVKPASVKANVRPFVPAN